MRIKRFTAPDMRTALRMVRDEQGPDAVILSSRQAAEGGVEVVAATDYDEALVQQTLRTMGAPAAEAPPPAAVTPAPARERAVFRIDGVPVAPLPPPAAQPSPQERQPSRLEQMMAAFKPRTPEPAVAAPQPSATAALPPRSKAPAVTAEDMQEMQPADFAAALRRAASIPAPAPAPAAAPEAIAPVPAQAGPAPTQEPVSEEESQNPAPGLRVVATDPAVATLRAELAAMRKVIERELGQFAVERLRGSPARAAALDALAAFGCDDPLAQRIAQRLDPTLPAEAILAPLRAELAAELPVLRNELLEDGGVVALLGPTGAGKTTTIAKLAARFAARHRARDVALISADNERAGAREQLHVLGRRLGVTVCDADGPEALTHALDQLQDYPLVLIDTAGHGLRDRALLRQILWVRSASNVRSLLVLPANAHPADLSELLRRYRPAAPEGVVLTKLDESACPGAALSVLVQHNLPVAYTAAGQCVPDDIDLADARYLAGMIEIPRRGATSIPSDEGHHAFA
jgi:flagellar biosynthesis protein FlhF